MSKTKRSSRNALLLIVVIVAIICGIIMVRTNNLSKTLEAKEQQLAGINADIEDAVDTTEKIRDEIRYRDTDDYIEDKARESLGLRYPDEIILVPGNGGGSD